MIAPHWASRRPSATRIAALWSLLAVTLSAAVAPQTLEVRLLTALSSTGSKLQGQPIKAMLMKPLIQDGQIRMPSRSILHGSIRHAQGVGFGFRRERASLDLEFTDWETPDGSLLSMQGTPLRIDNAREQVETSGRIRGILAASNPL